jgi:hypothetical protein
MLNSLGVCHLECVRTRGRLKSFRLSREGLLAAFLCIVGGRNHRDNTHGLLFCAFHALQVIVAIV